MNTPTVPSAENPSQSTEDVRLCSTIEELLELSNEQLRKLTAEDLQKILGSTLENVIMPSRQPGATKVTLNTGKKMSHAGMDVAAEMAHAMGMTVDQLRKMGIKI